MRARRSSPSGRAGQRVIEIIGGKKVHPVTALPGGMSKRVTKEEQQEMIQLGEQMVEFAKFTIQVLERRRARRTRPTST